MQTRSVKSFFACTRNTKAFAIPPRTEFVQNWFCYILLLWLWCSKRSQRFCAYFVEIRSLTASGQVAKSKHSLTHGRFQKERRNGKRNRGVSCRKVCHALLLWRYLRKVKFIFRRALPLYNEVLRCLPSCLCVWKLTGIKIVLLRHNFPCFSFMLCICTRARITT